MFWDAGKFARLSLERGIREVVGLCRRKPPGRVRPVERIAVWPETGPDDWCGEWLDREAGRV